MMFDEGAGLLGGGRVAEQPEQCHVAAGRDVDVAGDRSARVVAGLDTTRKAGANEHSVRGFAGALPADELAAVSRHRMRRAVGGQKGHPLAEIEPVGILRQQRAGRDIPDGTMVAAVRDRWLPSTHSA